MSRFNGAGMHRPYRHLVNAIAFDADEGVVVDRAGNRRCALGPCAQRRRIDGPCSVPKPRSLIAGVGANTGEIKGGALHARCSRKQLVQSRIRWHRVGHGQRRNEQSPLDQKSGTNGAALTHRVTRRGPQGDEQTRGLIHGTRHVNPRGGVHHQFERPGTAGDSRGLRPH